MILCNSVQKWLWGGFNVSGKSRNTRKYDEKETSRALEQGE